MRGGFEQALANLRRHRIRVYGTFIFGYDHDTHDCFRQTVDFARQHAMSLPRSIISRHFRAQRCIGDWRRKTASSTTPGGSTNDIDTTTSRSARRN